jgi:hypothetical protein
MLDGTCNICGRKGKYKEILVGRTGVKRTFDRPRHTGNIITAQVLKEEVSVLLLYYAKLCLAVLLTRLWNNFFSLKEDS